MLFSQFLLPSYIYHKIQPTTTQPINTELRKTIKKLNDVVMTIVTSKMIY